MKEIKYLKIEKLNGYIDVEVDFRKSVTILYGLNGSGKTSALRLMTDILSGNFDSVLGTEFARIEITGVAEKHGLITIRIKASDEYMVVSAPDVFEEQKQWPLRRRIDYVDNARYEVALVNAECAAFFEEIEPPLFLDINRRYEVFGNYKESKNRFFHHKSSSYRRSNSGPDHVDDPSLARALAVISESIFELRRKESRIESVLRERLLESAFEYASKRPDSRTEIKVRFDNEEEISHKKERVIDMLEGLHWRRKEHIEDYPKLIDELFEYAQQSELKLKALLDQGGNMNEDNISELLSIVLMQDKFDFLESITKIAEDYDSRMKDAGKNLEKFFTLVNEFLAPLSKELKLNERDGHLEMRFEDSKIPYNLLSSGERQIIILFTYLMLDRKLSKNGVFIIDEPELSLHVAWQDMFIDSMIEANSGLQFIFATHSPNIIGARKSDCIKVGKNG